MNRNDSRTTTNAYEVRASTLALAVDMYDRTVQNMIKSDKIKGNIFHDWADSPINKVMFIALEFDKYISASNLEAKKSLYENYNNTSDSFGTDYTPNIKRPRKE